MKNIILILVCYLSIGCSTTWKFEIDQIKYSSNFPKSKNKEYLNREMDFHNNYVGNESCINSMYFPDDNSKTWINIEHLVKLIDYDVKLLAEINNTHYLFSAIEFHKDLNIKEINLEHFIGKKKLKKLYSYIYYYPRDLEGKIDYNKKFIVKKIDTDVIKEKGQFIYVNIYEFPLPKIWTVICPKRFWFIKHGKEKIRIKYDENGNLNEKAFEFEIKWTKRIHWVT